MTTVTVALPGTPGADEIVRAYLTEVASRWHGRPATPEEVDRALRDEPYDDLQGATGVFFTATSAARVVGCAGARFGDGVAEVTKVFTRADHRGRGVARRLLDAVERACAVRGIGALQLDTRAELQEACALYERNGYERVEPFNEEPYSDRWYRKTLGRSGRP
uniref:GNAT family N-acetyltransferase n=1 Tax=Neobacillus citreus TaxID=2833578 RepID=A0A942T0B6_9BACI